MIFIKCKRCNIVRTTKDTMTYLITKLCFDETELKERILQTSDIIDYICSSCNNTKATITSIVKKTSDILIFNCMKAPTKTYPDKITIYGNEYILGCEIIYLGIIDHGHYIVNVLRKDGVYIINDKHIQRSLFKQHDMYVVGLMYIKNN